MKTLWTARSAAIYDAAMASVITCNPMPQPRRKHRCVVFDHTDAFANAADELLADGRALGQQTLRIDRATIADVYVDDVDPMAQVDAYRQAVTRALHDGSSGPRVVADVTELVRDHRRMLALDATGERVELRTRLCTAQTLAEMLHLGFVDVTLVDR